MFNIGFSDAKSNVLNVTSAVTPPAAAPPSNSTLIVSPTLAGRPPSVSIKVAVLRLVIVGIFSSTTLIRVLPVFNNAVERTCKSVSTNLNTLNSSI